MAEESALVRLWNRIKGQFSENDDFGSRIQQAVALQNSLMADKSALMQGGQKFGLSQDALMMPFRNQEEAVSPVASGGMGTREKILVGSARDKDTDENSFVSDGGYVPPGMHPHHVFPVKDTGGNTVMTSYGVEIPVEALSSPYTSGGFGSARYTGGGQKSMRTLTRNTTNFRNT